MFARLTVFAVCAIYGIQAGNLGYGYASHGYGDLYGHGLGYGATGAPIAKVAPVIASSYTTVSKTIPVATPIIAKVAVPAYAAYGAPYGAAVGAYGSHGFIGGHGLAGAYSVGAAYGHGYGIGHAVGSYGPIVAGYGAAWKK